MGGGCSRWRSQIINRKLQFCLLCVVISANLFCRSAADCPILIDNLQQLNDIRNDLDAWYVLIADINAADTNNWNGGAGFEPIGSGSNPFTGIFDGNGHVITDLYINRPASSNVGLFGSIGNSAEVKNVGLINAEVYGDYSTATLVGTCGGSSIISNCYATGTVTISANGSTDTKSGGLVGSNNQSTISRCYAAVDVSALSSRYQLGGLCGYSRARAGDPPALIENCYSIGTVTSDGNEIGGLIGDADGDNSTVSKCYSAGLVVGTDKQGLIGFNFFSPTIAESYWDTEASTCPTSVGGIPKTTVEMMQQATFVNWDFTNIWGINEGTDYPFLYGDFNSPLKQYYVDDDAPDDPGPDDPCVSDPNEDGSIDHPFDNIQEAIDWAYIDCNSSCFALITVRDGWYDGMGNYDIDTLGVDIAIKSEHGPWYTIIDPYGQGRGFIITKGETKCTLIDGFTIFDGYANPVNLDGFDYYFGGAIICADSSPIIQNCDLIWNYAYDSGGGIHLDRSDATIRRCEILLNECGGESGGAGGGINMYQSNPLIENCVVAGNYGHYSGGITCGVDSNATINNCTIGDNYAQNGPDGLECYYNGHANVKNSIFWTDTRWWLQQWVEPDPDKTYLRHIFLLEGGSLNISYSDIEGGYEGIYVEDSNCTLEWGIGNLNTDPYFAEYYFFDYHLKSGVGRWTFMFESNGDYNNDWFIDFGDFAIFALFWMQPNPPLYIDLDNDGDLDVNDLGIFCSRWLGPGQNFSGWVQDDSNSPCIDAGDPCSPYMFEPAPNGGRVNMGAYGNTEQASKSTVVPVPRRHPDMDDDGDVDFVDFAYFAQWWLYVAPGIPADFDYSGFVNEADLQEFCLWWLWGK